MKWHNWWAPLTSSIRLDFARISFLVVAALIASLGVALANVVTGLTFSNTALAVVLNGLPMLGVVAYLSYLLHMRNKGKPSASLIDHSRQVHDTGQPKRRAQRTSYVIAKLTAAGRRLRDALGRLLGAGHDAMGLGTSQPILRTSFAGAGIQMRW